jgi:alpha-L-arabinofuranosidase
MADDPSIALLTPTLTVAAVESVTIRVRLGWVANENRLGYRETEIYCRELGATEWKVCGIAGANETSALVEWSDSENATPLLAEKIYEFSVQNYGPDTPVTVSSSGQSAPLSVAT